MKIQAVLFDCDGTLVNSEHAHYLGWQSAVSLIGGDLTLDEYYPYIGQTSRFIAESLSEKAGKDASQEMLEIKRRYYWECCKTGLPPIASTVDFLVRLAEKKKELGIQIGVCSAARKTEIMRHLSHLKITHLLDIILSGQDDLQDYVDPEGVNKPKPYVYIHAMKKLGVKAENTIVIEDSAPGAAAGVAAGCFTIAIPNAYTKQHDFSHVHMRLESFSDVSIENFLESVVSARK